MILLTAHADLDRVLEAGTQLNISSFLIKPIHSLEQLHFDIQAAISRRDLERENRSLMRSLRMQHIPRTAHRRSHATTGPEERGIEPHLPVPR